MVTKRCGNVPDPVGADMVLVDRRQDKLWASVVINGDESNAGKLQLYSILPQKLVISSLLISFGTTPHCPWDEVGLLA